MNLYNEITAFYENYRGEKRIIGRSSEGRNLYALFVGSREGKIGLCQYAIHAREWITAFLAIEHIRIGAPRGGVWFLPLMNPDGAELCREGLQSIAKERRMRLLKLNEGEDFSLWKANAEGVDLNVNFPARWGTGASNIRTPAPENYIGEAPLSAPESRALAQFTRAVSPAFTVSYHTKGEEIYWRFHQPPLRAARDKKLAMLLSKSTGYPLKEAPRSAGGYKDWCVQKLKIPAFTVEAGRDSAPHPLGMVHFSDILRKNGEAISDLCKGF